MEKLLDGSYIDRIHANRIYGDDKAPLTAKEQEILQRIELALELLYEHNGNERIVLKTLEKHPKFPCTSKEARVALSDAKHLFAYIGDFDLHYELLLEKQKLNKMQDRAMAANDGLTFSALSKVKIGVLAELEKCKEKLQGLELRPINWTLHTDFTKLGVSEQDFSEWERELKEVIIPKVKLKYRGMPEEVQDAEYIVE